jgi:hypothetical protein
VHSLGVRSVHPAGRTQVSRSLVSAADELLLLQHQRVNDVQEKHACLWGYTCTYTTMPGAVQASAAGLVALALTALVCVVTAVSRDHSPGGIGDPAATGTCGYNDCADFCDGACPYRANMSFDGAENLTVYRLTPWNVTDLVNHNTGTAAGDVGFMLKLYMQGASSCTPPFVTRECFLADKPLVGRFNVEFDASYGPYLKCNPTNDDNSTEWLNMTRWLCAYGYPGSRAWTCVRVRMTCARACVRVRVCMRCFAFPSVTLGAVAAVNRSQLLRSFGHKSSCLSFIRRPRLPLSSSSAPRPILPCIAAVATRPLLLPLPSSSSTTSSSPLPLPPPPPSLLRKGRTPSSAQTATEPTCPLAPTQLSTRGIAARTGCVEMKQMRSV